MEETPILPIILGALVAFGIGYETERRRRRLRQVFDVFDRDESKIAEALETMVESGQLKPYLPAGLVRG
jgi:hypothetical protein